MKSFESALIHYDFVVMHGGYEQRPAHRENAL